MKGITTISAVVLSLILSVTAVAQDVEALLDSVRSRASESFVTVSYEMELEGPSGRFSDVGTIEAQDGLWHLKGGTMEIYTDSQGTWIADTSAKEAYIEPLWTYDDLKAFYDSVVSSGSVLNVWITSSDFSEKKHNSYFTPVFPSDWIITDLR